MEKLLAQNGFEKYIHIPTGFEAWSKSNLSKESEDWLCLADIPF